MYLELENKKLVKKEGEPELPKNGVLLKTIYCGICGSDKHRLRNGTGKILGHENVAKVIEDGKNVSKGDLVAINPLIPCEKCEMCEENQSNICENLSSLGKDLPGGFSSKMIAPEKNLYPLGNKAEKYVLADPLGVVIHASRQINFENKKVLIIGDGALGALTCFYLSDKSRKIHVKGRNKSKLKKITENTDAVNKVDQDYDIVFEAVGGEQSETLNLASKKVTNKGNIIVYGVFPNKKIELNLRPAFEKEANIIGINSYRNDKNADDFQTAMKLIENNNLDYLIETMEINVQNVESALDKKLIKPVLKH